MSHRYQAVALALLSSALSARSFALGTASYSSELISSRSLGQGGTGVAGTQNDPIAGYTNPAALTSLPGSQFTLGLSYVDGSPTFTNDQGQITGARATSVAVPTFGASTQFLGGRLSAGLAAVTPYGLETHFDGDSPVRYAATDARLRIVDVTPSVAVKINDAFSVGVGADYYNALEGALSRKVDAAQINGDATFAAALGAGAPAGTAQALGAAAARASVDANSQLNGNGDGWGYHLGTTVRPSEHHQIGIVYHSSVKVGLSGSVQLTGLNGASAVIFGGNSFQTNVAAPLFMPQNVQFGYAYMPDEKWMFEADAAWYDWYSARQLGVVYSGLTPTQNAVLNNPSQNPEIFNPRRTVNFGVGANYKQSEALQLRGGAYYQAAALPESSFDPAFIDLPRYAVTVGAGCALTKSLGLDLAYNAVFFHSRHVAAPGSGDPFANNVGYSGSFGSFANIVSASLSYRTDMHL
ncbi:MAG: OmpP1/FadL family transporter [Elusimicrobiota bacterium]